MIRQFVDVVAHPSERRDAEKANGLCPDAAAMVRAIRKANKDYKATRRAMPWALQIQAEHDADVAHVMRQSEKSFGKRRGGAE